MNTTRNRCVATAALAATLLATIVSPSQAATVQTISGQLSGVSQGNVEAFLGVPFAAPPVGEQRWRSPQSVQPWNGTRVADKFGASCYQRLTPDGIGPWTPEYITQGAISEDCLFLNVWTPQAKPGAKMPVLVWIHGGAFNSGSGSVPIYDGAALAKRGVVVVTINYRLGAFGFLAHPELTREAGGSGNYALEDMIAALKWVRENIASFGGDPGQVTIAGQSAGSAAVHNLIASPMAKGLFVRAIAQSGSGMGIDAPPLAAAEARGVEFLAKAGAGGLREARQLSADQILQAAEANGPPGSGLRFAPITDGKVIPPSKAGYFNDTPVLTGLTANEGSSGPNYGVATVTDLKASMSKSFGRLASRAEALYPARNDQEAGKASEALGRDRGTASAWAWALNRISKSRKPVYMYLYDHAEPGPESAKYKAFHSSEIPYVFQNLDKSPGRPFTAADRALSDKMASYWVNFIRTGSPNGAGLPSWPALNPTAPVLMRLSTEGGAEPVLSPDKRELYRDAVANGGQLGLF